MTGNQFLRLTWPEGVLTGLALVLVALPTLHAAARPFLAVFPPIVLASGLLVGWRFGRGRLVLALATLAAAGLLLVQLRAPYARPALALAALLVPANLVALEFLPEAPAFSRPARWWWAALGAEIVVAAALCRWGPARTGTLLFLPIFPVETAGWTALPQLGLLAFAGAVGVLGYRVMEQPGATVRGLLWGAIGAGVALGAGPADRPLYLGAAGLALLVAMIETSYALAFQDELTGLPGRRAFNQALTRLGGRYVVAMVDVDHFKHFNDKHGHDVGDQVLRMVAGRLTQVGEQGRGYRYGGEEFAVIFPDTALDDALADLEALRIAIEASSFVFRGPDRPVDSRGPKRARSARQPDLSVTVSIGAADARDTPAATVEAADQALYRAKESGRNRVVTGKAGRR